MVAYQHLIIYLLPFIPFTIFLHKHLSGTRRKNALPSPWKLPVIGNLHQLGTSPHRSLRALSKTYGHLLLLHLGRVQVLVASSAQAAREIMKNQDLVFSNRPKSSIADSLLYGSKDVTFASYGQHWRQDLVFSNRPKSSIADSLLYGSKDVTFASYGQHWRQVRSICVVHLLSNKRVQSYSRVREEEASAMVDKIKRLGGGASTDPGVLVNLSDVLMSLSNNVVCRVALGRKYGEDEKLGKLLREFLELFGAEVSYGDYIPCLGWMIDRVSGLDAKVERVAKEFDVFFEDVIREHRDGMMRVDGHGEELDFVDILLEFQKANEGVEDDTIKAIILDMFVAGTDTSAVTLEWAIAELIKNPRTMKTLKRETIGEGKIANMPYLKAVIKETLRLHPPLPLLVPHQSTRDTQVMGYDVPSGTRVFINAWAIGRDPCLWENPEEFRPERFLDSAVDYKGLHFELIPFGAGRRGCPGIAFAEGVVEIGLAKLVHHFNFELAFGERGVDLEMSEGSGLTAHKKNPLLVRIH